MPNKKPKKPTRKPTTAKRADHAIGFRVNEMEHARIVEDLTALSEDADFEFSMGAYAKRATLEFARHRKMVKRLRDLVSDNTDLASAIVLRYTGPVGGGENAAAVIDEAFVQLFTDLKGAIQ
jgi:hypothetical protein